MNEKKATKKDEFKSSPELMRAVAIIAVVIIHVLPKAEHMNMTNFEQLIYDIIHRLMNFAVPMFVMITGALMIKRDEPYKKCLQRAGRLFTALLIFGIPMSFLERCASSGVSVQNLIYAVADVLGGKTWDAMWYLYMIIGLYLFMPVISKFAVNADNKTILYILSILFVFNSIFPLLEGINLDVGFYIPCNIIYLFYAIAGYYIFCRCDKPFNKKFISEVLIITIIMEIVVSVWLQGSGWAEYYFSYSSPMNVVLTVSLFAILKDCKLQNKLIKSVSASSFGIYLVHCFFIHAITLGTGIYAKFPIKCLVVPTMFAVVFAASLVSTWILKKIPFVKRIL